MGVNTVTKNYKNVLDDLRISMSKLYEQCEIEGQVSWSEVSKYNRLQKLDKDVANMITDLYSANTKVIRGTLRGLIKDTYTNTISIVDGVVEKKLKGIAKDLPVNKIVNDDMAGLKWSQRVNKHRSDLIYDIQKEIKQGLSQGDTYTTMTKRLKHKLGVDTSKAKTIIRTESHRVKAQAKEESFDKIAKGGVKFKKKWLTAGDERVRGQGKDDSMDHVSMNGVIVDSDEDFVLPDGATGKQPGLTNSVNDINCRCIAVIELDLE